MIFGILTCDDQLGTSLGYTVPWNSPKNDRWIKALTLRSMIVMTRNEYERQLFARRRSSNVCPFYTDSMTFVLTSNRMYHAPGASVVHSWERLLEIQRTLFPSMRMYVLGGTTLWREAISDIQGIYMTHIHGDYICDRRFPFSVEQLRQRGFNEAMSLDIAERSVMKFPLEYSATDTDPQRTIRLFYRGAIEDNLNANPMNMRINGK